MTVVEQRSCAADAPPPRRPTALGAAAHLVAAAHQHAHRAGAAVPARRRGDPGLGVAAARGHPGSRPLLRRRTRARRRGWTGSAASTSTPRPGSRRSTCCCSPRWSAAWSRGCVDHVRALRPVPPDAPSRLDRLPQHAEASRDGEPAGGRAGRRDVLRRAPLPGRGARAAGRRTVAAEKGYLKETGNLLFHFALLALLIGVALGSWYGWHGNRLLVAGADQAFCNTLQQYDEFGLGPRVDAGDLPAFCLRLTASRRPTGRPASRGVPTPRSTSTEDGGPPRHADLQGQRPAAAGRRQRLPARARLRAGAALHRPVRQSADHGRAVPAAPTTCSPARASRSSPTSTSTRDRPARRRRADRLPGRVPADRPPARRRAASVYPAERDPALFLAAYRGDLGLDAGAPLGLRARPAPDRRRRLSRSAAPPAGAAAGRELDPGRRHDGWSSSAPEPWVTLSSGTTRASRSCWSARCSAGRPDDLAGRAAAPGLVPGHAGRRAYA